MANYQDGGVNAANTQKKKVGDMAQVAKPKGTNQAYALSPVTSKPTQQVKYSGTSKNKPTPAKPKYSYSFDPQGYDKLMSTGQTREYAHNQAQTKFDNEKLGYDQNIKRIQQLMGQLATDAYIKQTAEEQAKLKYADAILGVDAQVKSANTEKENTLMDYKSSYDQAVENLKKLASTNRGRNLDSAAKRGLYNSSIYDQMNQIVNSDETQGVTAASNEHQQNVEQLNARIGTLIENLGAEKNSLTKRQQGEMVAMIRDLTKERNNEKAKYQLAIEQQYQGINQARNNMSSYENELFQQLYGRNADLYRNDRNFKEGQRQFNAQMSMQQQQLNAQQAARRASEQAAREAKLAQEEARKNAKFGEMMYSMRDSLSNSEKDKNGKPIYNYTKAKGQLDNALKTGNISKTQYQDGLKLISDWRNQVAPTVKPPQTYSGTGGVGGTNGLLMDGYNAIKNSIITGGLSHLF